MMFFDMFAGIGGFRIAFEREGFRPVGWCEIDKWCQKLYRAYFKPRGEYFKDDILSIDADELPDFDVITAGVPCQPFSSAGRRRGLADERGLPLWKKFFEIVEAKQPKVVVVENVKGLLSSNRGWDFAWILGKMDESGYDAEWDVLNSKDFGVPQNRDRVFIIGHLRGESEPEVFPLTESDRVCYESPKKAQREGTRIRDSPDLCRAIDANYRKGGGSRTHVAVVSGEGIKIRLLTPLECFRLQGFPDDIFYMAKKLKISDTQLYKMAGNAVTVPVVQSIAKKLRKVIK